MSDTGRYTIRLPNGRVFTVEPLHEDRQRATDVTFRNGGITGDAMKHKAVVSGGSIAEEESIVTPENGYTNIQIVSNPMDVVEQALREDGFL